MRLNQYIARCGVTSRRKAEELILAGKVKINGKIVTELATEVNDSDKITVNDKLISLPVKRYYLLNKPAGYTVTKKDKFAEKTIFELLPEDGSLFAVGRLDKESRGLILITNDGNFDQKIIHPKAKVEKEYQVTLADPAPSVASSKLINGVMLTDGPAKALKAEQVKENVFNIVITEGRNRQIRRMFQALNLTVVDLLRVRIGDIRLDISEGNYRELTKKEVESV